MSLNMKKIFRNVQFAAHIAVIVIAFFLGLIVVKEFFLSGPAANNAPRPLPPATNTAAKPAETPNPLGKSISLQDVDWAKNKRTFVLYLSTNCRYCQESSPFYQTLAKEAASKGVPLVAVFPQDVEAAKTYLKSHDIDITQVVSNSLASIGVAATPTLLVVDDKGSISEFWRGKLNSDREKQVLAKLAG